MKIELIEVLPYYPVPSHTIIKYNNSRKNRWKNKNEMMKKTEWLLISRYRNLNSRKSSSQDVLVQENFNILFQCSIFYSSWKRFIILHLVISDNHDSRIFFIGDNYFWVTKIAMS